MNSRIAAIVSISVIATSFAAMLMLSVDAVSYPPAVGLVGNSQNCLSCHAENGPWKDDDMAIVDMIDKATGKSLRQNDGSFLVEVRRNEPKAILTVLGRRAGDETESPTRNGWLYVDLNSPTLTKFPPGWQTNVQYGCRVVGDTMTGFEDARVTVSTMTIAADDKARNGELTLQAMVTRGSGVKGKPREGLTANYFERKLKLKIVE